MNDPDNNNTNKFTPQDLSIEVFINLILIRLYKQK